MREERFAQLRVVIVEVANGTIFQSNIKSFRGDMEDNVRDCFDKFVINDLRGFVQAFHGINFELVHITLNSDVLCLDVQVVASSKSSSSHRSRYPSRRETV